MVLTLPIKKSWLRIITAIQYNGPPPPQEEVPVNRIINVLFIILILYLDSMGATYHYVLNNVTIKNGITSTAFYG